MIGLVPLVVSIVFLCVLMLIDGHAPSWHALGALVGVALLFAFTAALGLGLSVLVTFYRDIGVALPNILMVILFATPILYPLEVTHPILAKLAVWNPLYIIAEWVRDPLVYHRFPDPRGLLWVLFLTLLIGRFTLNGFRRVKGNLHSAI
jgi:lipopolysaccharide transport system permease protein